MILLVKLKLLCMFFSTYWFHPSGPSDAHSPLPLPRLFKGSDFKITHKFLLCAFVTGMARSRNYVLSHLTSELKQKADTIMGSIQSKQK